MGTGEEKTPAKLSVPTASTQEIPTASLSLPWVTRTPIQAHYGSTTSSPYFSPTTTSPIPHPLMWNGQQLMQPYGTPLPYPAYYHNGVFYPHPNMNMSQSPGFRTTEPEANGMNEKDRAFVKKPNVNLDAVSVVNEIENRKSAYGSGNDAASDSAESGSEASSYASDENTDQHESSAMKKRSFSNMRAVSGTSAMNNETIENNHVSEQGSRVGPGTYHQANLPSRTRANVLGSLPAAASMAGGDGVENKHLGDQDERERRKLRRKLSNRESARRSRLRKQAECDELQVKVDKLSSENLSLIKELRTLAEESTDLTSENASMTDELTMLYGKDFMSAYWSKMNT